MTSSPFRSRNLWYREEAVPTDRSSLKDAELVNLILSDIVALQNLAKENPKRALDESDPWLMLRHPGGGHLLATPAATDAINILTRRAITLRGLDGQIAFSSAKKILKDNFPRDS